MAADRRQKGQRKADAKSAVTNGSRLLPNVDGRSVWARRFRDLVEMHHADLGGDDVVSGAQHSLARRAAALEVELERMEAEFATNGAADTATLDAYQRTSNTLRRLLSTLGIERKARNATPSLNEYLDAKREVA